MRQLVEARSPEETADEEDVYSYDEEYGYDYENAYSQQDDESGREAEEESDAADDEYSYEYDEYESEYGYDYEGAYSQQRPVAGGGSNGIGVNCRFAQFSCRVICKQALSGHLHNTWETVYRQSRRTYLCSCWRQRFLGQIFRHNWLVGS